MYTGHYISEHDKLISQKLAYVMCGGDLSAYSYVSEQYLLDLEREAFLISLRRAKNSGTNSKYSHNRKSIKKLIRKFAFHNIL